MKTRFALFSGALLALALILCMAQLDPNIFYQKQIAVAGTNFMGEGVVTNGLTLGGVRNTVWPGPSGAAGGVLSGSYPNPGMASGAATNNIGYVPLNKAGDTATGSVFFKGPTPFIDVTAYGLSTSSTDNSGAISNAVAAAPPTGAIIFFPTGVYAISNQVNIVDKPNVQLMGSGCQNAQYFSAPTGGTVFKWTGASGGTMFVMGATTNSTQPVEGSGFHDCSFNANGLGGIGLMLVSVTHGRYEHLYFHNFGTYGLQTTTTNLSGGCNTQGNLFADIGASCVGTFATNGIPIYCSSYDPNETCGNTSVNTFINIQVRHSGNSAFYLGDADSNTIIGFQSNDTAGSAAASIEFGGSTVSGKGHARHNVFLNAQTEAKPAIARGQGLTQPSGPNFVMSNTGNGIQTPTIENGASLAYMTDTGTPALSLNATAKTSNYNMTLNDYAISADTSGGAFSIFLPSSPYLGEAVVVRVRTNGNILTVDGNGNNILGASTWKLASSGNPSISLQYNGTQWEVQ